MVAQTPFDFVLSTYRETGEIPDDAPLMWRGEMLRLLNALVGPISSSTHERLMANGEGPPIAAEHNGRNLYDPKACVAWFRSRLQRKAPAPNPEGCADKEAVAF
jgi:hypothetical protein